MIRLAILTEGYTYTGYGHIARCSAIANAFRQRGVEVCFILNGDQAALSLLKEYTVYPVNWLEEKEQLLHLLSDTDLAVIDSYLASEACYTLVAEKVETVIYLDDFVRLNYPPGLLVNGTVGAEKLPYKKQKNQALLLGANYVLLREPFFTVPPRNTFPTVIQTILITFGGTDPKGLTQSVLPLLTAVYPDTKKWVVVGAAFSSISELERLADRQTAFFQHVDAEQMNELMQTADVAVSAAGQTLNELGRTGLPAVVFKVADNQENNLCGWQDMGFINSFIDATTDWSADEFLALFKKLEDVDLRKTRSRLGQAAVDGNGAIRIAQAGISTYYKKRMVITEATEEHLVFLFNLANDEEVRKQSFSTNPISFSEHAAWFHAALKNSDRLLYVCFADQQFLGQVRFDLEEDFAVVSISVHHDFRGLGLAPELLRLGLSRLKKDKKKRVKEVYAYVKDENIASQKTFIKAGFTACVCEKENTAKFHYPLEL